MLVTSSAWATPTPPNTAKAIRRTMLNRFICSPPHLVSAFSAHVPRQRDARRKPNPRGVWARVGGTPIYRSITTNSGDRQDRARDCQDGSLRRNGSEILTPQGHGPWPPECRYEGRLGVSLLLMRRGVESDRGSGRSESRFVVSRTPPLPDVGLRSLGWHPRTCRG